MPLSRLLPVATHNPAIRSVVDFSRQVAPAGTGEGVTPALGRDKARILSLDLAVQLDA